MGTQPQVSLVKQLPRIVPGAIAAVVILLLCEITGVHRFITVYASRGSVSESYYWSFQAGLCAVMIAFVYRLRPARAVKFSFSGALIGYLVALVLFNAELLLAPDGFTRMVRTWRTLGAGTGAWLSFAPPVILLAPFIGMALFATYAIAARVLSKDR